MTAARSLLVPTSDAATAIDASEKLLVIETTKTATNIAYRLLKDTALIVTDVLTTGATTVVQVVTSIVEVIVEFVYKLVYSLVFQSSVKKCREWVRGRAVPGDLDLRGWTASCPLLGAYFLVGLAAGGGAVTALSMFSQPGVELSSTDFQDASVKLLKVRQAAAAYVAAPGSGVPGRNAWNASAIAQRLAQHGRDRIRVPGHAHVVRMGAVGHRVLAVRAEQRSRLDVAQSEAGRESPALPWPGGSARQLLLSRRLTVWRRAAPSPP